MRQAFMLLGIMTLVVTVGAFIAFERAEAPTVENNEVGAPNSVLTNSDNQPPMTAFKLTSPVFENGGLIPSLYTCDGENTSPELHIEGVPEGTVSLILVMDDPDIPDSVKQARGIEKFDHWALYNIPPDTAIIPATNMVVGNGGKNSKGETNYTGPCPPDREHRYFFQLYAVSGTLNFIKTPAFDEIETAAQGMTLASTTLVGRYKRMAQ